MGNCLTQHLTIVDGEIVRQRSAPDDEADEQPDEQPADGESKKSTTKTQPPSKEGNSTKTKVRESNAMLEALESVETRRKLPKVPSELSLIMKMQNYSVSTNEPPRKSHTFNHCPTIPEGHSDSNIAIPKLEDIAETERERSTTESAPGPVPRLRTVDTQTDELVGCTISVQPGNHGKSGTVDNTVELSYTVDSHHLKDFNSSSVSKQWKRPSTVRPSTLDPKYHNNHSKGPIPAKLPQNLVDLS